MSLSTPTPLDAESLQLLSGVGIGSSRIGVFRAVLANPDISTPQLQEMLGHSRNGLGWHLKALVKGGLITERQGTHPRGAGRLSYWNADAQQATALIELLNDLLIDIN